jgi:hypothetical protein
MDDDGITIDTSDFDKLAEILSRFPDDLQNKLMQQSLQPGAQVLHAAVIEKCPVRLDEPTAKSTGAKPNWLKADIRMARNKSGHGWRIGAGPTMAYLLRWLELGHRLVKGGKLGKKNKKKGTTGVEIKSIPAYPVLRPAFDENTQSAVHAIAVELGNQIVSYWKQTLRILKKSA